MFIRIAWIAVIVCLAVGNRIQIGVGKIRWLLPGLAVVLACVLLGCLAADLRFVRGCGPRRPMRFFFAGALLV
jgi:hypothetical protein